MFLPIFGEKVYKICIVCTRCRKHAFLTVKTVFRRRSANEEKGAVKKGVETSFAKIKPGKAGFHRSFAGLFFVDDRVLQPF